MICTRFPLPKDLRKLSDEQLLRADMLKVWKEFNAVPDHVRSSRGLPSSWHVEEVASPIVSLRPIR
jgi:hypothetical protein